MYFVQFLQPESMHYGTFYFMNYIDLAKNQSNQSTINDLSANNQGFSASSRTPIQLVSEQKKKQKKHLFSQNQNKISKKQAKTQEKPQLQKDSEAKAQKLCSMRKDCIQTTQDGRIFVRIQWKNENRNIIPNIMNQLISFLSKPFKSKNIVGKMFSKRLPNPSWNTKRFYHYIKLIKENFSHYLDEEDLKTFFAIQFPHSEIYSLQQQAFYLKVCRIGVNYFLRNEAIVITSTSSRMNENNRKIHLVGREVLLKIFSQMAAEHREIHKNRLS